MYQALCRLSIAGAVVSALVHVLSASGLVLPPQFHWIPLGLFPLGAAMALTMARLSDAATLRSALRWRYWSLRLRLISCATFAYPWVLGPFLLNSVTKQSHMPENIGYLLFSSGWMALYTAFGIMFWAVHRSLHVDARRSCQSGHTVFIGDSRCPDCGLPLEPTVPPA